MVASVSCIYGIGSPDHYTEMSLALKKEDGIWQIAGSNDRWANIAYEDGNGIFSPKQLVNSLTQADGSLSQQNFLISITFQLFPQKK